MINHPFTKQFIKDIYQHRKWNNNTDCRSWYKSHFCKEIWTICHLLLCFSVTIWIYHTLLQGILFELIIIVIILANMYLVFTTALWGVYYCPCSTKGKLRHREMKLIYCSPEVHTEASVSDLCSKPPYFALSSMCGRLRNMGII